MKRSPMGEGIITLEEIYRWAGWDWTFRPRDVVSYTNSRRTYQNLPRLKAAQHIKAVRRLLESALASKLRVRFIPGAPGAYLRRSGRWGYRWTRTL